MKIVIAPDSFKGSLSAIDVCNIIEQEINQYCSNIECIKLPLADGGEGTLEAILHATNGELVSCKVADPLGRTIIAPYGVIGNSRAAYIEMAQASGLPLLQEHERNPLLTTTTGTGDMIVHAMEHGYSTIYVGLGGSATNDGGIGMLEALGIYLLSAKGQRLPGTVASLEEAVSLDFSEEHPLLRETTFYMISDVNNPLCGTHGASQIFGPQKGASTEMIHTLELLLMKYGQLLQEQYLYDVAKEQGAGAAGGLGATLLSVLHAKKYTGIEYVIDILNASTHIASADLIITGEGRLDAQTLSGKVIQGVCSMAKQYNKPVIAICGGVELTLPQLNQLGLLAAYSLVSKPCSLQDALTNSETMLRWKTQQIIRTFLYLHSKKDGDNYADESIYHS